MFKSWFVDFEPFRGGEFVDSELGLIPKGWRVVSLGEVTKQITEKVGNREDVTVLSPINSGELVLSEEYFTKQVFSKDLSKYLIVNPLSFAYNPARINIGSIGLNTFDFVGCVSPVYVVFECEPNYQYFFDFFKRTAMFKDEVALRAIGGVRQSLGYNDLSLIKIIYPTSDVVVEFNNLYLKMKEVMIKNTDQNEKFIFCEIPSPEADVWRAKKLTNLIAKFSFMEEYKLSDIAEVRTGPFGSQLHNEDYVSTGTPIVTVEHLGNRRFSKQNLPLVSDDDKKEAF